MTAKNKKSSGLHSAEYQEIQTPNTNISSTVLLNLPCGSFTEESALNHVKRYNMKKVLRNLSTAVKRGKLIRTVVKGTPVYTPCEVPK